MLDVYNRIENRDKSMYIKICFCANGEQKG